MDICYDPAAAISSSDSFWLGALIVNLGMARRKEHQ